VGDGLKENLWETYRVSLKARVSRLSPGSHESLPPLAIGRVSRQIVGEATAEWTAGIKCANETFD